MILLTPGPVTTRPEVRAAMTHDFAPWDPDFDAIYAALRDRIRALAGGIPGVHAGFALQGSGHFAVEAAIRSFLPPGSAILVPGTGQYAARLARLATECGRPALVLPWEPDRPVDPAWVADALAAHPGASHVGIVQSETSTGIVHDVAAIGAAARAAGRRTIIDAISAFGALPLDMAAMPEADAMVTTTNKCLEALPGASFLVCRIAPLEGTAGRAGSWSLDLADMLGHARKHGWGQFRFTPPAQVLNAARVALDVLDAEGGPAARLARYTANMNRLYEGVGALGLAPCLPRAIQGPIVMNVHTPAIHGWTLQSFADDLKARGVVISNFSNTAEPSMRLGAIGALTPDDMGWALDAIADTLGRRAA